MPKSVADLTLSALGQNIATLVGANPAAGAEFSQTVPAGQTWLLYAVRAQLITSIAVANRRPSLFIDDGTNNIMKLYVNQQQAASLTINFDWVAGIGINQNQFGTDVLAALPYPLYLPSGYRIRSSTDNIDVADDWGAPVFFMEVL